MTTTIGIRRALLDDASCLDDLLDIPAGRVSMQERLQQPDVFTYLAEDAVPFGFVTVGPSDALLEVVDAGEVLAWFLAASHRGQGMGRKLLVHGLSVLKRRQYEHGFVWLDESAERALQVVSRLGFEPTDFEKVDNFSGQSVTSRAWVRDLDDFF